jgi:hypothetical protein
MSKRDIRHLLVLRMEQLKVGTNDLPSVAKKKVVAATTLVSSMEAFPTTRLALQLEVPMAAANILRWKVGEECWNSGLDGQLEAVATSIHLKAVVASIQQEVAVAATSEAIRLRVTLPTTSRVLGVYENPVR